MTLPVTAATDTIVLAATVIGLGVTAQVLADKLAVPSVLFLIHAGVAVGSEGLDFINA